MLFLFAEVYPENDPLVGVRNDCPEIETVPGIAHHLTHVPVHHELREYRDDIRAADRGKCNLKTEPFIFKFTNSCDSC